MKVLSLFDGMSGGRIALERAGIEVDKYFASEVDKFAMQVSKNNYPDIIQVGSVTDLRGDKLKELGEIDLLIGGSPCQSFSRAGDGSGFDGKSKLFWEFVRILKEVRPKFFMLENVVMRKEWEKVITDAVGVEPIMIDSCNFSAQKRQRLFWVNIKIDEYEDRNILLSDIVKGEREEVETPLLISENPIKIRNATKQGFLIAEEGDSVNLEVPNSKTRRGRVGKGKTNTLNTACNYGIIQDGKVKRLTINDYEALQTIPKDYTSGVSDNQRKKMIGNGWTIDVIAHILKNIKGYKNESLIII